MHLTRRQWLATSAALSAATIAGPAAAADGPVPAPAGFRHKLSVAGYSFRQHLPQGDKLGTMTLFDLCDMAAELGLAAVEPTGYYFTSEELKYAHAIKTKAHSLGLDISGTAIRNDFCHPDANQRANEIVHVKKWVDIALHLGAPCIRVFAGNEHQGQPEDVARALVVESMKQACDYAGKAGVYLALENHGYLTGTAAELQGFLDAVNHEWLAINLDSGNFTSDPYGNMARIAHRAVNVQFKLDLMGEDGKKKVPADFARIFAILRDAGYRGYVALEYEGKEDPHTGFPKFLADVRAGQDAATV
jgi:sugar phosphate isomerase/epimerase